MNLNKFTIKLIFAIAVFLSTTTVAAQEKKLNIGYYQGL